MAANYVPNLRVSSVSSVSSPKAPHLNTLDTLDTRRGGVNTIYKNSKRVVLPPSITKPLPHSKSIAYDRCDSFPLNRVYPVYRVIERDTSDLHSGRSKTRDSFLDFSQIYKTIQRQNEQKS